MIKLLLFLNIVIAEFMAIFNLYDGKILWSISFLILAIINSFLLYQQEKINQELNELMRIYNHL